MQVERCQLILRGGEVVEMAASPDGSAVVVPTFTPAHFERVMNTRASASSVERRQRTMQVEILCIMDIIVSLLLLLLLFIVVVIIYLLFLLLLSIIYYHPIIVIIFNGCSQEAEPLQLMPSASNLHFCVPLAEHEVACRKSLCSII